MPWLPLHVDLPDHAKSLRLGALLNEHNAHVYPLNLWCWASQHAPDGRIEAPTVAALIRMVEDACRWRGTAGHLFRALVHVRFVDTLNRPTRGVFIHNWDVICGAHLRSAERHADRAKRRREAQRIRNGQTSPRSKILSGDLFSDDGSVNGQGPEFIGVEEERARTVRAECAGRAGHRAGVRVESTTAARVAAPRALELVQTKPVVAVGKKKRTTPISKTTTTAGVAADLEVVDQFGFALRNCDLAQDLLERVRARLNPHGAGQLDCWAVSVNAGALELGVIDSFAQAFAEEHHHLQFLEALREEEPTLEVEWCTASRPPAKPAPIRWTLEQCVRWMASKGINGGASDRSLRHFWVTAATIPPSDLMLAAANYRSDPDFEKKNWPLAVFISDNVWKSRVPALVKVAVREARP